MKKSPPQIAVKFANMIFVLGILFSILLVIYALYKIYNPAEFRSSVFYFFSMLCGLVLGTFFSFGVKRLNNNLKVNLSISIFIIGMSVYIFEAYLEFFVKTQYGKTQIEIIAKNMGITYDTRTKMEILEDLRASGVEAFPNTFPLKYVEANGFTSKKGRLYPLGTISNSITIFDNESGYYPIIETDEHGFNNPKGLYIENEVDIILTGDSFTEGYSVHSNQSISAVLRELDFNTISVGKGSNGPLIEFATLKEYAEPLKPRIVLWLYYVNDFINLKEEMKSSILRNYLNNDGYSQNLISRQEEIDRVLIDYVNVEWGKQKNKKKDKKNLNILNILNILKLTELRKLINLEPTPKPIPIFRDILEQSNQMVLEWGGKMYFVYLPEFAKYKTGNEHIFRDFVMQTATELKIPIIDIHQEVFAPHPDPFSLFPLRMGVGGHYNAEGYKLIAEVIGKRLEEDALFD